MYWWSSKTTEEIHRPCNFSRTCIDICKITGKNHGFPIFSFAMVFRCFPVKTPWLSDVDFLLINQSMVQPVRCVGSSVEVRQRSLPHESEKRSWIRFRSTIGGLVKCRNPIFLYFEHIYIYIHVNHDIDYVHTVDPSFRERHIHHPSLTRNQRRRTWFPALLVATTLLPSGN